MTSPEAVAETNIPEAPPSPPPSSLPPYNVDKLRSLNSRLLTETVERREKVRQLQSRIDDIDEEHSSLSLLERDVTRIVIAGGLAEVSATVGERKERDRLSVAASKDASEGKVKDLIQRALSVALSEGDSAPSDLDQIKREFEAHQETSKKEREQLMENLRQRETHLETLEAEKVAIMKQLKCLQDALVKANERLMLVNRENAEQKISLEQAKLENTANCKEMEVMKTLTLEFQNKVKSIRKQADDLTKQKELLVKEHEVNITKAANEDASLKKRIATIECEKANIKAENSKLKLELKNMEQKVKKLQSDLAQYKRIETQLSKENDVLKSTNENLEQVKKDKYELDKVVEQSNLEMQSKQVELDEKVKENTRILEDLVKLRTESKSLWDQRQRLVQELKAQKAGFVKEVDDLKNHTAKIHRDIDQHSGFSGNLVSEVADFKNEFIQLRPLCSEIQELFRVSHGQNAQLKNYLECAESNLLIQNAEASSLRMQIEELKMSKEDIQGKLQNAKAELASLLADSENKSKQYDSSSKEKASLEEKLVDVLNMFKEMEVQSITSKVNIEKAFNLLKSTSDAINELVDIKKSDEMAEKLEEQEMQFEIRQIEKILDDIKLAFKSRIEKNQGDTSELELLQSALVEAKKKEGKIWMWLYPAATTILAAITLAYAAKSRQA